MAPQEAQHAHSQQSLVAAELGGHRRSPFLVDDATLFNQSQALACGHFEGNTQYAGGRVKTILEHHGWRYLLRLEEPLLRELCDYLHDDFRCLSYPMPRACSTR